MKIEKRAVIEPYTFQLNDDESLAITSSKDSTEVFIGSKDVRDIVRWLYLNLYRGVEQENKETPVVKNFPAIISTPPTDLSKRVAIVGESRQMSLPLVTPGNISGIGCVVEELN